MVADLGQYVERIVQQLTITRWSPAAGSPAFLILGVNRWRLRRVAQRLYHPVSRPLAVQRHSPNDGTADDKHVRYP